ncbi:AraC family transcriptional regulator [Cellulomonas algicola]|uniref:AraC family transcriptional regulator n=1 Tax=Cellulomonas algicola TaxID=2071633 RepID=A0A401V3M1_9CELL|nr:helix-turn-helix domain-containing protein [Cellulomonas algicola]GCD21530.1 AraC family transcriptional regulator [Cellulomonas algicola]
MPRLVAVVAFDGISPFLLAVPQAVLGARPLRGTAYDVQVCASSPGSLPTEAGYEIRVPHGLDLLERADLVVLPSWDLTREPPADLLDAVRAAHARGARVVGLCLGAFVVAAAGLVDGREAATHWHAAETLARRHPSVHVRSDVLWSDLGDVVTSAGVAAALDCCLHVVRTDLGAHVAAEVARSLVLAPHRDGSQAQFVPVPVAPADGTDPVARAMAWAAQRLDEPLDLDTWATHAHVSRRTLTRQFRARTGTSPSAWLLEQRLARARALLEQGDEPVEVVARRAGFGSSASLRAHFARRFRTSPRQHRAAFRQE